MLTLQSSGRSLENYRYMYNFCAKTGGQVCLEMVKIREKDINLVEYDRFLEKLSELTVNEKTKEKIKNSDL